MTVVAGGSGIRDAYSDHEVAVQYVDRRFKDPIGEVLHAAQARFLLDVMRAARPKRVLEIAPGPARLSVEMAAVFDGRMVLVDSSAAMLNEGRRRLAHFTRRRWDFVRGDAFALPVHGPFDLVYSFRLVRHFQDEDRQRLYEQVASALDRGGLFVFDAVNRAVAERVRARGSAEQYPIYDALLAPAQLQEELDRAGFDLVSLRGVQKRYAILYKLQVLVAPRSRRLALAAMRGLERCPGGQPLEWVVLCRKR